MWDNRGAPAHVATAMEPEEISSVELEEFQYPDDLRGIEILRGIEPQVRVPNDGDFPQPRAEFNFCTDEATSNQHRLRHSMPPGDQHRAANYKQGRRCGTSSRDLYRERLSQNVFAACKKERNFRNEIDAEEAVAIWRKEYANDKSGDYSKVTDEDSNTMLMVASENGYQEVVRELLKDFSYNIPFQKAIAACKEVYSEENEIAAVEAVESWLKQFANDKSGEYAKVTDEDNNTMLVVASKNGYPMVVETLLEDEHLVESELNAWAQELQGRSKEDSFFSILLASSKAMPSGFTLARRVAMKGATDPKRPSTLVGRRRHYSFDIYSVDITWSKSRELKCKQGRCTSCYDTITLYTYIGQEIPDAFNFRSVIVTLRELGWMSMDDIQDHWGDLRKQLRKKKVKPFLVANLSEARYNYSSWHRQFFKEEEHVEELEVLTLTSLEQFLKQFLSFRDAVCTLDICCMLGYAIVLSLIVFVPVIVLIFHYDLIHYEEQLWSECFVWLSLFALAQMFIAFWTAPDTGWGMIKESSRDNDLGETLRGSLNQQGLVSTLLFSTIIARLQFGLSFDLTSNVTDVYNFELFANADPADYTFAEHALAQWYAVPYMHAIY